MNTLIYRAPRHLTLEQVDTPEPQAHEVLIEVDSVGICGSEVEGYLGHSSIRIPPLVMGHEFCGTIHSAGAQVSHHSPGQRVVVNPLLSCGMCERCRQGRDNICDSRTVVGIHRPGAFADFVAVPAAAVYYVPQTIDEDAATLVEPLACAVHAVQLGMKQQCLPQTVIFGAGTIGILSLQAALIMGSVKTVVVDTNSARLETALKLGAQAVINPLEQDLFLRLEQVMGERGVDLVVDAVGLEITKQQSLRLVNSGGTIVVLGLGQNQTSLPANDLVRKEVSMTGSYAYTKTDFRKAVQLIAEGHISTKGWSAVRSLAEGPVAFKQLADGNTPESKIFLRP